MTSPSTGFLPTYCGEWTRANALELWPPSQGRALADKPCSEVQALACHVEHSMLADPIEMRMSD